MKKLLILALLLLPGTVLAQYDRDRDRDDRRRYDPYPSRHAFELTPFAGYRWGGTLVAERRGAFDFDVDTASAANLGAAFGFPIGDTGMKIELLIDHQDTNLEVGGGLFTPGDNLGNIDITYYHAGLQIPFSEGRGVTPFFVISAGSTVLRLDEPGTDSENRFSASTGLGVKIPFNRNIGLRIEGRAFFTSTDENRGDGCSRCGDEYSRDFYQGEANVGLVISF